MVEDVAWHRQEEHIYGSVGDDKLLKLWDTRQSKSVFSVEAHSEEVLCLDFSSFNTNLLLTGSVDKTVAFWDRRNLRSKVHNFSQHKEEVNCVKFHPHHENLFATGSSDRRIIVWDVSKVDQPLTEEER